jgi:hypothetical protein
MYRYSLKNKIKKRKRKGKVKGTFPYKQQNLNNEEENNFRSTLNTSSVVDPDPH